MPSFHPLKYQWALWVKPATQSKDKKKEAWDSVIKMCVVSSVEEFVALLNTLKPASWQAEGLSYFFFKEGVKPEWEDPANLDGGAFKILTERPFVQGRWDDLLSEMVVGGFERDELLCGASVSIRPKNGDRFEVWTKAVGAPGEPGTAEAAEKYRLTMEKHLMKLLRRTLKDADGNQTDSPAKTPFAPHPKNKSSVVNE